MSGAPRATMTAVSAVPPLRRVPSGRMVGGVCTGLGRRFGVDPVLPRVLFVVAAVAGGWGILIYLAAWGVLPDVDGNRLLERLPGRRAWQVGAGMGCLVLASLLALRQIGLWFGDGIIWPLVLAASGGALVWRQAQGQADVATALPGLRREAVGRVGLGTTLVLGAALVFLWRNNTLAPARDLVLAVVVLGVVAGALFAPWWVRLARSLAIERAERIRTQERAEVAAHLHDSVLQTLALLQKRADDPRAVATLARRQERELRAWLNGGRAAGGHGATLASALQDVAAEVEERHQVAVDVVTVGDWPLDAQGEALVAAVGEALTNAAKFAGEAPISVFCEAEGDRVEVFVRDRGPGFDLAAVPADRRGVRESIVGRLERHGGHADVRTAPGSGTEVELVLERA
jgi:signal transduction histidine kinase